MLLITNEKYKVDIGSIYYVMHEDKSSEDMYFTVLSKLQGYHLCLEYLPKSNSYRHRALFQGGEREENLLNRPNTTVEKIDISYDIFRAHGQTIK